ncbi:TIGR02452 family protein [Prosthecobacter sp.]|uniref:TIGR02452 family protein n=1 Tax=Prosthecobacter sp. TaxID=1965333 RepID=UPI0037851F12
MKRSTRQELARQTVQIVEQGHYTAPSGKRVDISHLVRAAKHGTRLYETPLAAIDTPQHAGSFVAIEVTGESTFAAMQRLHREGKNNIGCLNFASAKNPGGGFLNGAEAQEEALSRSSALYDCLLCAPAYYERNRSHHSCLYLDLVAASPRVPFFRDDAGELLEDPVLATVITAPAPNAGAVSRNEPGRLPEVEPTLRRRATQVLQAAVDTGIECLVLGAWGCGVFRNDPRLVARTFAMLLQPGGAFVTHFKEVVFAVYDPTGSGPNLKAFKDQFSA